MEDVLELQGLWTEDDGDEDLQFGYVLSSIRSNDCCNSGGGC